MGRHAGHEANGSKRGGVIVSSRGYKVVCRQGATRRAGLLFGYLPRVRGRLASAGRNTARVSGHFLIFASPPGSEPMTG
jgi:hypothetical protein